MEALATALVIIFCTPFGWIGLLVFGWAIAMIYEVKKGK
jgi:hypothetical protein